MDLKRLAETTCEDLIDVVAGVLSQARAHPGPVQTRLVDLTADATNMAVVPELSAFNLPAPAAGLAQLLVASQRHPGRVLYEIVRQEITAGEADRLAGEAYDATWPHLRKIYPSPMAPFGLRRDDYELVPVADLPAPHNLSKGCPTADRLGQLVAAAHPPRRWQMFGRPAPVDPAVVRARAWRQFQSELAYGTLRPCLLRDQADAAVWAEAMAAATGVWLNAATWEPGAVYRELLATAGVGEPLPAAQRLAWSLLRDPVWWPHGTTELANGHRRLCGASSAGVSTLLVLRT